MLISIFLRFFGPFSIAAILWVAVKYQPWFIITKGRPPTKRVLTTVAIGFIVTLGASSLAMYPMYHKFVSIQHHGRRAVAEVIKIYTECHRSGCSQNVAYRYKAFNYGGGTRYMTGDERLLDRDLETVRSNRIVPIAYDLNNPQKSLLNFREEAFLDRTNLFFSNAIPSALMFSGVGGGLAMMFASISLRKAEAPQGE